MRAEHLRRLNAKSLILAVANFYDSGKLGYREVDAFGATGAQARFRLADPAVPSTALATIASSGSGRCRK
ncbi:hypothetical protein MPLB_940004 [Mesorhizobium sp. ORS 3324]|nr:hypothetical protein MPLB_940004 [Mesorhizobium sp. ORS 3324]